MGPEIKLKLLSGSKFVLADCLGCESELFVPVIINKRIVLQNVVASRRCCKRDFLGSGNPLEKLNSNNEFLKKLSIPQRIPLANSTPTQTTRSSKENISISIDVCPKRRCNVQNDSTKINLPTELTIKPFRRQRQREMTNKIARIVPTAISNLSQANSPNNRFPTPDIVRRAALQNFNESIPLPSYPQVTELKIVRLHRTNTPNVNKKFSRVVRSKTPLANISSPRVLRNLSNLSNFGSPPSLYKTKETSPCHCRTPNQSFLARITKTPDTVTKWRKCITPQRTYIRHSNKQRELQKTNNLSPLQLEKNGKFIDNHQFGVKLQNQVVIKRRRLIIDNDVKISPRKFLKQLTCTEDLKRNKYELPKSRKHFDLSHMTAFDFLTNSNHYPKIGKELNTIFRQGCVNKRAGTILKYKQLTRDIPSLELSK